MTAIIFPNTPDPITIVDFWQDADSFGWSILALFTAASGYAAARLGDPLRPTGLRWGVLDCVTGTENGAAHVFDRAGKITGFEDGSREAAIRRVWHLVDWHPSEASARAAIAEVRSRRW